jgi:uncharacterized cupredoxin-like copper-binding protein
VPPIARNVIVVLSIALLTFGVAACGDGDSDKATETATTAGGDKGQIVKAELGESSGSKYFVKVDKNKVKAGKVTFQVTNVGELYHEFIVYLNQDGIAPGDLPIASDEDVADLAEENVIGEAPYAKPPIVPSDKKPGDADHRIRGGGWGAELTVDLKPGKYILLCNLEGHYSKFKQYIAFTVE